MPGDRKRSQGPLAERKCILRVKLEDIMDAIRHDRIRITDHADEEAQADNLSFNEVLVSVFQGEVIEEYLADMPYPSCLIYGKTFMNEPVHSVWAYNKENRWAILITVYRPDPERRLDCRQRRPKDETF